jgi:hypothetical protein
MGSQGCAYLGRRRIGVARFRRGASSAQAQRRPVMFSGDGGVLVLGGRREGVEELRHGDAALLATLIGPGEQPRRRRARQWPTAAQGRRSTQGSSAVRPL